MLLKDKIAVKMSVIGGVYILEISFVIYNTPLLSNSKLFKSIQGVRPTFRPLCGLQVLT